MNLERINRWTHCLYALIQSLHIAKAIKFGNLNEIDTTLSDARAWLPHDASFATSIHLPPGKRKKVVLRRDPNAHFTDIVEYTTSVLVQDLVVIFDSLMLDIIEDRNKTPANYPQSKIDQLKASVDPQYLWATNGCYELVAVRNCIVHSNGKWNQKSIDIVRNILLPIPSLGDTVSIGFPVLFLYRKAIRTFLNQAHQNFK